jgi:hypothetical protein
MRVRYPFSKVRAGCECGEGGGHGDAPAAARGGPIPAAPAFLGGGRRSGNVVFHRAHLGKLHSTCSPTLHSKQLDKLSIMLLPYFFL